MIMEIVCNGLHGIGFAAVPTPLDVVTGEHLVVAFFPRMRFTQVLAKACVQPIEVVVYLREHHVASIVWTFESERWPDRDCVILYCSGTDAPVTTPCIRE
jgi:hypothetical protein